MRILNKGGATVLFVFIFLVVTTFPFGGEARADDGSETSFASEYMTSGGLLGFLIWVLGIACVVCLGAGLLARWRGAEPAPWRRRMRGMGEAAFLLGILGAFTGMHQAMNVVARLGAAVAPSDLAAGISHAVVPIILGCVVALVALLGGGLVRVKTS